MAQSLLIGLGGTGSRVVNNVVKELHLNGKEINDGQICCAVLDTNVNDIGSIEDSDTGVPVVATSKAQKIRNYFEDYHHLHMETWCPKSPAFMEESMLDGASELRLKSRIAFMDCYQSGVLGELESLMNNVLENNEGSKIRIMIVSSLSGGTGSGMFIQVALWLRKFFSQSEITIRGIFLLPDVFVSTIDDIKNNNATKARHYCNAYAAIRELNAITKIKKSNSLQLSEPIEIGDLFNSKDDADTGKPVYDFAFFVDDKDEHGVPLSSVAEYEKMVAQLVYMQLYSPMKDDMYSEEDNFFLSCIENEEPLFGSCGTSKAVYPTESVKLYSAIRAAQDSITGGWNKIDSEIDALVDEKKQREEDGYFSNEVIDVRAEFMRIFENKISVKEDEVGKDRFFVSISRDVKNETKVKEGDKVVYKPSDKVEDFINLLKGQKIDVVVTKNGGTEDFAIDAESFISADHSKDELLKKVGEDETGLSDALDTFDKNVEKYADAIIDTVFPYSMGEVKPKNRCSVYGLLTKPNEMGGWDFIHPVAARYVLYRLVAKLEKAIKGIALKDSREEAVAGGDIGTKFDNPKTSKTEKTPVELLNSSKGLFQSESSFFDDFERRYADFITAKIELCEKYEKEALQISVFRKLIERLNNLINKLESFFGGIGEVQEKLQSELNDNIAETNGVVGKTVYVYGSKQDKEAVYQSLNLEVDRSNSKINKSVIDSIYGGICAEKRASNPENQEYVGISVINSFVLETVKSFMEKIDEDENNKEKVYLDIYTALCKESDVAVKSQDDKSKKSSGLDSLNLKTGTIKADHSEANRHKTALNTLNNKLKRMAAPFLIHNKKLPDNSLGIVTTRFKTFWGFSPDVAAAYPAIGAELGVNADLQADSAYPKNELYCYRAVYGLEASYIPKFNELSGGLYYTCYDEIVGGMVEDAAGRQGERAFVRTPHLDMRWHNILPYVSDEKQKSTELGFFHGFWLAVAYGILKLDKEGNFCIRRSVDGGYGMYFEDDIALKRKDKNIYKTDVLNLIEVLKADKVFTGTDIPALEQRFKAEMEELITYEGTEVLKGLTTKVEDLNPICIVSRYNETIGHKKLYSAVLVKALEDIAGEMAASYKVERSEKQCEEAKYGICKRIYDSSARYRGKADVFGNWETAFEKYKLKETSSPDDSSM